MTAVTETCMVLCLDGDLVVMLLTQTVEDIKTVHIHGLRKDYLHVNIQPQGLEKYLNRKIFE